MHFPTLQIEEPDHLPIGQEPPATILHGNPRYSHPSALGIPIIHAVFCAPNPGRRKDADDELICPVWAYTDHSGGLPIIARSRREGCTDSRVYYQGAITHAYGNTQTPPPPKH